MTTAKALEVFADVQMDVEVQVDRRQMTLKQILEMEDGGVIKLPRSAGENMDVLIGGALIGRGEVVIIDDTVGIRITDFGEED